MDNAKPYKMIFVGGGTLGHVLPNLTIIHELKKLSQKKKLSVDFLYVGRIGGIEKKIVEKEGLKYKGIFAGKLRRYKSWKNLTDFFLILFGFIQSIIILLLQRPDLVFAKGGFVTVPFCLACAILKIPFIVHESDSLLGLSNKVLLPFAKKIYLGFPIEAYGSKLPEKKAVFTGNPVREEIADYKMDKEGFYNKHGYDRKDYLVFGYIGEEMADFLNNADLIISRAGANSLSEIIAVEKPSILIPLPGSASDHQRRNALFLQKKKAASVLDEKVLTPDKLFEEIDILLNDKKAQDEMVKNMENIFPKNSGKEIAEEILRNIK